MKDCETLIFGESPERNPRIWCATGSTAVLETRMSNLLGFDGRRQPMQLDGEQGILMTVVSLLRLGRCLSITILSQKRQVLQSKVLSPLILIQVYQTSFDHCHGAPGLLLSTQPSHRILARSRHPHHHLCVSDRLLRSVFAISHFLINVYS